eukprot:1177068-Prorocentrum_minimum.AAC.2
MASVKNRRENRILSRVTRWLDKAGGNGRLRTQGGFGGTGSAWPQPRRSSPTSGPHCGPPSTRQTSAWGGWRRRVLQLSGGQCCVSLKTRTPWLTTPCRPPVDPLAYGVWAGLAQLLELVPVLEGRAEKEERQRRAVNKLRLDRTNIILDQEGGLGRSRSDPL